MKGKVLFIVHDQYQDFNHFPCGTAYLASSLRQAGVDVQVYSQDVYHFTNEQLADFLEAHDFNLICLGFLAARFKETIIGLCEVINQHKKDAWLVLGGHGVAPIPEYVLRKTNADIACIGEGEITLGEILSCQQQQGDISSVKGVAFVNNDIFYQTQRQSPIKDLDSLPFPAYDLFPMDIYTTCLFMPKAEPVDRTCAILTGRGCSNRCNFCYRMEHGIRLRKIPRVVDEIEILSKEYGVTYLEMFDELFVFSKKRMRDFGRELKQRGLKIKYCCQARVDFIDEEMLDLLKESGCVFLNFGLESADQNVLNLMNKNATVEQNERAVQLTAKSEIAIGLNFLWGNKGDTAETLRANVDFLKKYNMYDQVRTIRPPTPYPGCDLYYEAIERGLLSGAEDFFNRLKNPDRFLVNFTDLPDQEFYELLFAANKELIFDHFKHTSGDMDAAQDLVNQYHTLYFHFTDDFKFRGARIYTKKD